MPETKEELKVKADTLDFVMNFLEKHYHEAFVAICDARMDRIGKELGKRKNDK